MNKKIIAVGLLLAVLVVGSFVIVQANSGSISGEQKIGYVDMDRLFQHHPERGTAEDQLRKEAQKMQQELEEQAEGLEDQERQQLLQHYQGELQQLEEELIQGVMEDINEEIRQAAERNGVEVVFDKSVVVAGGHNLTEEVLEIIEE